MPDALSQSGVGNRIATALRSSKFYRKYVAKEGKIRKYRFADGDVRASIKERYSFDGDLLDIFTEGVEKPVHKWHHYIPIYDRYFSRWRNTNFRFLEIGVWNGGSLEMWRKYFGDEAVIFGIDIDEDCRRFDGLNGCVRIGSQNDAAFLTKVVEEMGGVDVVLDDGSHNMNDIRASIETLFPQLSENGIYLIEDLHTSYWEMFGGGYNSEENFFNYVRELVDDMHRWYHTAGSKHSKISDHCCSIHIHDSICVLEKSRVERPVFSIMQSATKA